MISTKAVISQSDIVNTPKMITTGVFSIFPYKMGNTRGII